MPPKEMEPIAGEDEVAGDPQAEAAEITGEEEMALAEASIAEGDEKDGEIDASAAVAANQMAGGDDKGGELDAAAATTIAGVEEKGGELDASAEMETAPMAGGGKKYGGLNALAAPTVSPISDRHNKGICLNAFGAAAAAAITDRDKKGRGLDTLAAAPVAAAPPPQPPLLPDPLPSYKDVVEMLRSISPTVPTVGIHKSMVPGFGDKESLREFAAKYPSCDVIIKEHMEEQILIAEDYQEASYMLQCIEDCKYRHMNLGGSKSEFDDFAREFSQLLSSVSRKKNRISHKELMEKCHDEHTSRSIIVFLKLAACAVACETWAAACGYQNAAAFCLKEIVPTNCEGVDGKIISLVVSAFRVPVRVFTLTNTRLLRQDPQDYLSPSLGPPRPFLTFMVRAGCCEVLYS
ncbi:uncharacterized protein LOC109722694 isoform X2 [Ananas comosus]|uniref:Uncharacterized protein LOC109722694 isoform X2 n=1 Tax=Ananas comosus TaxID=4615 RepID=A0A6P5GM33_ANACO|nr:uncharacterized protein LOC109722694 isoform X2 [Ananas comosus]